MSRIYKHMNDLSRAQILSDTIIDEIRGECSSAYIVSEGDVWIASEGASGMTGVSSTTSGPVLVVRKNSDYCMTVAADYAITSDMCNTIKTSDEAAQTGAITSRAVYRMFSGSEASADTASGYVHFGYFENGAVTLGETAYIYPAGLYDFTSPFLSPTYGDFTVGLKFSGLTNDSSGKPSYVLCEVTVNMAGSPVYTRQAVICFSSIA